MAHNRCCQNRVTLQAHTLSQPKQSNDSISARPSDAYFIELQHYFVSPKSSVTQEFSFTGIQFYSWQLSAWFNTNYSTQGTESRPVIVTSTVNPGLSFSARLEINHDGDGVGLVLVTAKEDYWHDAAKWGAKAFTDRISCIVTLQPVDENADLAAEFGGHRLCEATVVNWRIRNLRPGIRLWIWGEDRCCHQFHCAIVMKVSDDTFQYQLSNGDASKIVEHTANIRVGYESKIFRVLPPVPSPQSCVLIIGRDHELHRAPCYRQSE